MMKFLGVAFMGLIVSASAFASPSYLLFSKGKPRSNAPQVERVKTAVVVDTAVEITTDSGYGVTVQKKTPEGAQSLAQKLNRDGITLDVSSCRTLGSIVGQPVQTLSGVLTTYQVVYRCSVFDDVDAVNVDLSKAEEVEMARASETETRVAGGK